MEVSSTTLNFKLMENTTVPTNVKLDGDGDEVVVLPRTERGLCTPMNGKLGGDGDEIVVLPVNVKFGGDGDKV
jgi:hypothetical protein